MPQQPKQPVRALAHTNSPKRDRITQVREQREIRNATRRHPRIFVMFKIGVVKYTQPRRAENLSALLDQLKVPAREKGEVMQIVGSLKPSIVQVAPSN